MADAGTVQKTFALRRAEVIASDFWLSPYVTEVCLLGEVAKTGYGDSIELLLIADEPMFWRWQMLVTASGHDASNCSAGSRQSRTTAACRLLLDGLLPSPDLGAALTFGWLDLMLLPDGCGTATGIDLTNFKRYNPDAGEFTRLSAVRLPPC